jgi:hypothetical protein
MHENQQSQFLDLDALLNSDGLNLNEASGVSRLKSTEFIHRRLLFIVQALQAGFRQPLQFAGR